MRRSWLPSLIVALLGCPTDPTPPSAPSDDTSASTSSSTGAPASTGDTTSSGDVTGTADSSSAETMANPFIIQPDGGGMCCECNLLMQDCPEGQKCMPYNTNGGIEWNGTRCVPIAEDPGQPGEPCTIERSPASGLDDCELGAVCWYYDYETEMGICVALCTGDDSNPVCEDPNTTCTISGSGLYVLCLPNCDPLQQDCVAGQGCYPDSYGDWLCTLDASGDMGGYGDPCEYYNACDPGLVCISAPAVPGCMDAAGCCSEVCDLTDPTGDAQCSGAAQGQTCQPWYEPGRAPEGLQNVGVCALP